MLSRNETQHIELIAFKFPKEGSEDYELDYLLGLKSFRTQNCLQNTGAICRIRDRAFESVESQIENREVVCE